MKIETINITKRIIEVCAGSLIIAILSETIPIQWKFFI